jgi:hypothetical protein
MTGHTFELLSLCLIVGTAIAIPVSIAWLEHRTRTRGLDTLRIYAERGEEPPSSVIEAVTQVTNVYGRPPQGPPKPQTRGGHLTHAAGNAVLAIGLTALVWWRVSTFGERGTGIVVGFLAAVFFAGGFAARLVAAYFAPEK